MAIDRMVWSMAGMDWEMGGDITELAAGGLHGFAPVLTSFVGRAGDLGKVAGLLYEHRLVTVTGPGGAGKTRLAGEVAARVADRFADGVWLVELTPIRDPALVQAALAAVLGVREQAGLSSADALTRVLGRQQLLLVLDNCEHVIGAAAELCAGLLLGCDDLRVLATSREPLRVAGEARYRLPPLALPGIAACSVGDLEEAAQLALQAEQLPADIPGSIARAGSGVLAIVLTETGDLAAAERICAAGLAQSRDVGDLWSLARRGAAMSLATVAEYALMLTAPGSPLPQPSPGLGRLSAREEELITLAAQGRTDAQLAAQLYISASTVRSHLDRIRDKTGCRRRADLTRLALGAGLV